MVFFILCKALPGVPVHFKKKKSNNNSFVAVSSEPIFLSFFFNRLEVKAFRIGLGFVWRYTVGDGSNMMAAILRKKKSLKVSKTDKGK